MTRPGVCRRLQRLRRWSLYERTKNRCAPEIRAQTVRMEVDHERDYPSRWAAVVSIADRRVRGKGRRPRPTVTRRGHAGARGPRPWTRRRRRDCSFDDDPTRNSSLGRARKPASRQHRVTSFGGASAPVARRRFARAPRRGCRARGLCESGRAIDTIWPERSLNDWNDVLLRSLCTFGSTDAAGRWRFRRAGCAGCVEDWSREQPAASIVGASI